MKNILKDIAICIVFIILLFPQLYSNSPIYGGDYTHLSPSYIDYYRNFSFTGWLPYLNLGWSQIGLLGNAPYTFLIGIIGSIFGYNTVLVERIVWWLPFFLLSFISVFYFKKVFSLKVFSFLPYLIFIGNTYVLMILGGGQLSGVGLSYAIAPLVIAQFMKIIASSMRFFEQRENPKFTVFEPEINRLLFNSCIAGLLFATQVMFDLRLSYVTFILVILYFLYHLVLRIKFKFYALLLIFTSVFVIPLGVTTLFHLYWIIPTLHFHINPLQNLGQAYTSVSAVKFLSFATLEQSLSLLHPNWPENIFGKVYFMKPEFLILPVAAFASLLFLKRIKKSEDDRLKLFHVHLDEQVLFFVFIGLLGAFLAKGANQPFGDIYLWLFSHVGGFSMFRDSTKWYLLPIISYTLLIPITLENISSFLQKRMRLVSIILPVIVVIVLCFFLRQGVTRNLTGTFRENLSRQEYVQLNTFLRNDSEFGRVLWIPSVSRFADICLLHPFVYGIDFFNNQNPLVALQKLQNNNDLLSNSAIKYVIVPDDYLGEIFLKDRVYDEKAYLNTVAKLSQIKWLKRIYGFEKIAVFEIENSKDHFWSEDKSLLVGYKSISPTNYLVTIRNANKGSRLVFSESYDPNWEAKIGSSLNLQSSQFDGRFNSFILPEGKNYMMKVYYKPERWVNRFLIISGLSLITIFLVLIIGFRKITSKHE